MTYFPAIQSLFPQLHSCRYSIDISMAKDQMTSIFSAISSDHYGQDPFCCVIIVEGTFISKFFLQNDYVVERYPVWMFSHAL